MYYVTAFTTLLSAALGLCFSIGAFLSNKSNKGKSLNNSMYMFARSLALFCIAVVPVCMKDPAVLIIITSAMLIVQLIDCIIGIIIKNIMRTIGPFIMSVCHAVCLLLFYPQIY